MPQSYHTGAWLSNFSWRNFNGMNTCMVVVDLRDDNPCMTFLNSMLTTKSTTTPSNASTMKLSKDFLATRSEFSFVVGSVSYPMSWSNAFTIELWEPEPDPEPEADEEEEAEEAGNEESTEHASVPRRAQLQLSATTRLSEVAQSRNIPASAVWYLRIRGAGSSNSTSPTWNDTLLPILDDCTLLKLAVRSNAIEAREASEVSTRTTRQNQRVVLSPPLPSLIGFPFNSWWSLCMSFQEMPRRRRQTAALLPLVAAARSPMPTLLMH